jgi:hypothetical protein
MGYARVWTKKTILLLVAQKGQKIFVAKGCGFSLRSPDAMCLCIRMGSPRGLPMLLSPDWIYDGVRHKRAHRDAAGRFGS